MAGSGFFEYTDKTIMAGIEAVTNGQMSQYSSMIGTIVTASVTLWLLITGFRVMAGKQVKVEDITYDLGKMAIILVFVNNTGGYLDASLSAIEGLKTGFTGTDSAWTLLDQLWAKAQKLGDTIYDLDDSTYVKDSGAIGRALVWIGACITMFVSVIVFGGAEITIQILTVVSPIFIFCLMFGFLRQMFNNWLQIIFSALLTILFASLVLRVGMNYLDSVLVQATQQATEANMLTLGAQACAAGFACGFVVWLSSKFASQLAGVSVEGAIQGAIAMGVGTSLFGASKAFQAATGAASNAVKGGYEGSKGTSWSNKSTSGKSATAGYAAGRVGRAAIQKVKARNKNRAA